MVLDVSREPMLLLLAATPPVAVLLAVDLIGRRFVRRI